MAFRYGQNYQTVHIYDEIQHIDIEPYKYSLKLQISISNRIHTMDITHMYIVLHSCTSNRVHMQRSYTFIHRTKYIYVEIIHL